MERNRDCPECGAEMKGATRSCRACGWEPRGLKAAASADPNHGKCEWTAGMMRCCYPGSMSLGTRGDLPFYCPWHFMCSDPVYGEEVVRQSREWDGTVESYMELRRRRASREESGPAPARSAEITQQLSRLLGFSPPRDEQEEPGARG